MTRIEAVPPTPVVKPPRRFHLPVPRFSLGRLIKLGIVVFLVWVLVLIAKTGLWQIPFISQFAYHRPSPIHIASPTTATATLTERLANITNHEVDIPDSELTTLASAGVSTLHLGVTEINVAAISGDELEFSFAIPQRHNALVRITLQPVRSADNHLTFNVSRTRIGEVTVPSWVIGEPTRLLLLSQLTPLLRSLPALRDVRTTDFALVLL